uniref:uncharacterized protein isoform X5 n=1 Tax=Myxine glutinosa TaxID=7769 RepID=UPI00358F59AE
MDRDPRSCAPSPSSSDSKWGSDGGNRGGLGRGVEICEFRILDVHKYNLRDGGDDTDQEPRGGAGESGPLAGFFHGGDPHISSCIRVKEEKNEDFVSLGDSTVVVKVEPDPTDDSPSQEYNAEVMVKPEHVDNGFFQGEIPPVEIGWLPDFTSFISQGTLDGILVKQEPCQTSLPADEGRAKHVEKWLSSTNNVISKYNTRSKGSFQNSCEENNSNHHPGRKSQFKCHVCKKVFPHYSQLTAHKVVHGDVKRYKCRVCKKAFALSSQLDKHEIAHAVLKRMTT